MAEGIESIETDSNKLTPEEDARRSIQALRSILPRDTNPDPAKINQEMLASIVGDPVSSQEWTEYLNLLHTDLAMREKHTPITMANVVWGGKNSDCPPERMRDALTYISNQTGILTPDGLQSDLTIVPSGIDYTSQENQMALLNELDRQTKNDKRVTVYRGFRLKKGEVFDQNKPQIANGLRDAQGFSLQQLILSPRSLLLKDVDSYYQESEMDEKLPAIERLTRDHKTGPSVSKSPFISTAYTSEFSEDWVGTDSTDDDTVSYFLEISVPESLIVDPDDFMENNGSDMRPLGSRRYIGSRVLPSEDELLVLGGIHPSWIVSTRVVETHPLKIIPSNNLPNTQ
jgi:hypothetical protein